MRRSPRVFYILIQCKIFWSTVLSILRIGKLFLKGPDTKYLRLCRPRDKLRLPCGFLDNYVSVTILKGRNTLSSQVVNEPVAIRMGPTGYSLLTRFI